MINASALQSRAISAFNRGDWRTALHTAQELLAGNPRDAAMHYVAGVACMELQQLPYALRHLRQASSLDLQRPEFAAQFAKALALARLYGEALTVARHALALAPTDAHALDTLGVVFTQCNAHDRAAEAFRHAASLQPAEARHHFNLATALIATGELEEAGRRIESCLQLNPRLWKAHLTLAQLRRWTHEHNHLDRLTAALAQAGDDEARMYVHLALAKEHEDLGRYAAAFTHLVAGKSAGGAGRDYSIGRDAAIFDALCETFDTPIDNSAGHASEEPIFVIGMPRSGTTVVERIISSHPDVHSAGELQNFGLLLKRHSGSATTPVLDPDTIARARHLNWERLGRDYIASTRPATGATPRFLDKLPHNFLYAGCIARALPRARIICLRREPMDTCLSNFRQLFARSSPYYDYSFDLLDTGRYYLLFDRLMQHWHACMPGRILEIGYEELVRDPVAGAHRLVGFCGLSWHDACLQSERNSQPVATASSAQVRQPIHPGYVQRWKHYLSQSQPLREMLGEAGITITG